jgi:hypothetical protein
MGRNSLYIMKKIRSAVVVVLVAGILAGPAVGLADDKPAQKPKPYPLKTCIISGDKLGEMGEPFVMVQDGREIKFCCKSCSKDFKKDPAKYLKKIDEEAAKEKKKTKNS